MIKKTHKQNINKELSQVKKEKTLYKPKISIIKPSPKKIQKKPRHIPYKREELSEKLLIKYFKYIQRDFEKTKTFKKFNKKTLKKTDNKYAKEIKEFIKHQYDIKGQSGKIVMAQIKRKFFSDTRKRFYKTKIWYWGLSSWRQDKKGKWHHPHPVKRQLWRDRYTGKYLRSKRIGMQMLKAMEPDFIRRFMQLHKIKNYGKGRSKYLKVTKNLSLRKIIELYGTSP